MKLKDFLTDALDLPCDEFDAVASAGKTIVSRLQEMMTTACFAFLVLTGEDDHGDARIHARENVIHEAGLFQGLLGFEKAIVLLEEGCCEFSNIHGLVQIRFPKGGILARSEDIRRVLLRENVLNPDTQRGLAANVGSGSSLNVDAEVSGMKYKEEVYWQVQNGRIWDGPFCPRCYDGQEKKAHMRETYIDGVADMSDVKYGGHMWVCQVCQQSVDRNPSTNLRTGAIIEG